VKDPNIVKLLLHHDEYRNHIKISYTSFDDLFLLYGKRNWKSNKLRVIQSMYRLKIPNPVFPNIGYGPSPENVMDNAASNGNMEMIQWLCNNQSDAKFTDFGFRRVVINGHLDMVKWLFENQEKFHYHKKIDLIGHTYIRDAALNGDFEMVKYLYRNNLFTGPITDPAISMMDTYFLRQFPEISNWLKAQIKP
jgi:hypothetical protein